jgi:hypothetical protein
LKYLQDAIDILPTGFQAEVVIMLASGNHLAKPNRLGFGLAASYMILGKVFPSREAYGTYVEANYLAGSIVIIGESSTIHDPTQAGTVSLGNLVTRTAGTWIVDEHKGRFCRFLTGVNAGEVRVIVSNTTTALTVEGYALTGGACTFEIATPDAVVLDSTDGINQDAYSWVGNNAGQVVFSNVQLGSSTIRSQFTVDATTDFFVQQSRLYLGSPFGYAGYLYSRLAIAASYVNIDTAYPMSILYQRAMCTFRSSYLQLRAVSWGVLYASKHAVLLFERCTIHALSGNTQPLVIADSGARVCSTNYGITIDGAGTCPGIGLGSLDGAGYYNGSYSLIANNCSVAVRALYSSMFQEVGSISGSGNTTAWQVGSGSQVSCPNATSLAATNEINLDGDIKPYTDVPSAGDWLEGKSGSRFIR